MECIRNSESYKKTCLTEVSMACQHELGEHLGISARMTLSNGYGRTPGKPIKSMSSVLKNCGFEASLITLVLGTDDVQTGFSRQIV